MYSSTKAFLLVLLLGTCLPNSAFGDYIQPGDVKVNTAAYVPENTDFAIGRYEYDVDWQGIPVAVATVMVETPSSKTLKVEASAKTGDVISLFYRLRFKSESTFKASSLKPVRFVSLQKENSKEKRREISFASNGVIKTVYRKNGKLQDTTSFESQNATFDPISAAFLARSLPVEVGTKRSFDVFNGKHRYLIDFEVEALEKIEFKGQQIDAFRVRPTVTKLTDTEGENRLKYARIWISADDKREVLRLESKVLVGKVSAELSNFVPRPSTPKPVLVLDSASVISPEQHALVGN